VRRAVRSGPHDVALLRTAVGRHDEGVPVVGDVGAHGRAVVAREEDAVDAIGNDAADADQVVAHPGARFDRGGRAPSE
jgi:hypothetical protein